MAESLKQFLGKEAVPIFGWTQGVPVEEQAIDETALGLGMKQLFAVVEDYPQLRADAHFLALEEELARRGAEARCGLLVIDLRSGDVAHWLRVEGMVRELYDVAVLPGASRPMALGFKTDEIQRIIAIGADGALE